MTAGAEVAAAAFHRFLAAVAARDLDAVVACFAPDARYGNVPHPPAVGRDAIRDLLGPILNRSTEVRWDVLTEAVTGNSVVAERVDRFVIDGTEYAAACCGVYVADPASGLITEVRDYVDLGPWRASLAGVL
ncbi:nuclear transport factor 2 family protein [Jatrophihabitans sp. YIM 134969]